MNKIINKIFLSFLLNMQVFKINCAINDQEFKDNLKINNIDQVPTYVKYLVEKLMQQPLFDGQGAISAFKVFLLMI